MVFTAIYAVVYFAAYRGLHRDRRPAEVIKQEKLCGLRKRNCNCNDAKTDSELPVLDLDDWRVLLEIFDSAETDIEVVTFHRLSGSHSGPAFVDCSDGNQYWIKGHPALVRETFLEQVVGSLGLCLDAPIPPIKIVKLGQTLHNGEPRLQSFAVGYVHGLQNEPDCSDNRQPLAYHDEADNRSRFAALAILYSWTGASDHQFIYKKQAPHLVFSFDHGLFFGVQQWPHSLNTAPLVTSLDPIFLPVKLQKNELAPYFDSLDRLNILQIAAAVARAPISWKVALDEKLALCQYLERRREEVLRLK